MSHELLCFHVALLARYSVHYFKWLAAFLTCSTSHRFETASTNSNLVAY